jgi:hypothetical protein
LGLIVPSGDTFAAYQVSALAVVQALAGRESARAKIEQAEVWKILAEILAKFTRHTIVQSAVAAFVIATVEYGEFSRPFVEAVVPIAVAGLTDDAIALRGFGWNFLKKLKAANGEFADEDAWAKFEEFETIVAKPYGGALPPPPAPDVGGDAGPNAQLMQMLMALMAASRR